MSVAVVTGASSGIGREFARRLAQRGYQVLAVARRDDLLDELARQCPGVLAFPGDVTDPAVLEKLVARAEELGGIDLVVCNAGRGHFGPFHDAPLVTHEDLIDLNLVSTVGLVHRVLPSMHARAGGGVIVLSSNLGVVPTPNMAVYAATKAFLLSWTHALAHENRRRGVRFLAVCPGPTVSGFSDASGLDDQVERTPGHTTSEQVVEGALRAWDAGRQTVVPGRFMNLLTRSLDLAPRTLGRRVMGSIFA